MKYKVKDVYEQIKYEKLLEVAKIALDKLIEFLARGISIVS
ncbi:hypothetical protein [Paenibacillus sp. FSL K6-2524]